MEGEGRPSRSIHTSSCRALVKEAIDGQDEGVPPQVLSRGGGSEIPYIPLNP